MSPAPVLFQETRLATSEVAPAQILSIDTAGAPRASLLGAGRKRSFGEIGSQDEESFARKSLATEASVYFRADSASPRSFLWRVIDERKVLEVQNVDLVQPSRSTGGPLSFRFTFKHSIARHGVVLAEPEGADALEVFVLTTSGELYTITLKKDLLAKETVPTGFDGSSCFKKYASQTLQFRKPYRVFAVSSLELLISLQDGGFMRLQRAQGENGSAWNESLYSEGGWSGTFRGLVPFRRLQTVRFGDTDLDGTAIAAIATSPDGKRVWTVTLDHELKAWDVESGRVVHRMDLLNEEQEGEGSRKTQRYLMSAESSALIQVVSPPSSTKRKTGGKTGHDHPTQYFIVVHSPKDHQFKLYAVSDTFSSIEGEGLNVQDTRPTITLKPPVDELLDTSIWHLEDFFFHAGEDWKNNLVWLRARSGVLCKTFRLQFSASGNDQETHNSWQSGWTVVDSGFQTIEKMKEASDYPGNLEALGNMETTPSELWLRFVFRPSRFTPTTIETALNMYRKGRGLVTQSSGIKSGPVSLQDRLTQAITSKIMMRRRSDDQLDYEGFQADVQVQWKAFYSLLSHLHNKRSESLGLAFDSATGLAWHVCADFIAPIREGNSFDFLTINSSIDAQHEVVTRGTLGMEDASFYTQLLAAMGDFRSNLSGQFKHKLLVLMTAEALEYEIGDHPRNAQRVRGLYEQLSFGTEIMDDEFQALADATNGIGGLGALDDGAFLGVLERMDARPLTGRDSGVALCHYGNKFMSAAAQATLERDRGVLLDLLSLAVFMAGDLDEADLHPEFIKRIGEVYEAIVVRYKHNLLLSWLVSHTVPEPVNEDQAQREAVTSIDLLERIFIGDWTGVSSSDENMPELLTAWATSGFVYAMDLHKNWDGITGHILAFLVKERYWSLATEFQKFISQGEDSPSWLRYLEGRLALATGLHARAALKFKAGAEGMAEVRHVQNIDGAHLLKQHEHEFFGSGLSSYFQHVASLFEGSKIYSYTAEFASLALDTLGGDDLNSSIAAIDARKQDLDSPATSRIDNAVEEIRILRLAGVRDDLLNRIFSAAIQIGRFQQAFDALADVHDPNSPTRRSNLGQLVDRCIQARAVPALLSFDFNGAMLGGDLDRYLHKSALKQLSSATSNSLILNPFAQQQQQQRSSSSNMPFWKILYVWRMQSGDLRGAASILYSFLTTLRNRTSGGIDPSDERLPAAYVLVINALACLSEDDAWILVERDEDGETNGDAQDKAKRQLVTLADVRTAYGAELDARSDATAGRFGLFTEPFADADGDVTMDVTESGISNSGLGRGGKSTDGDVFA